MRTVLTIAIVSASLALAQPAHALRVAPNAPTSTATGTVLPVTSTTRRAPIRRASSEKHVAALRQRLLRLTNSARQAAGLPLVHRSALLETSAQAYAEDMARRGFFSHTDPDGKDPATRIAATGYKATRCRCVTRTYVGENIAKGQGSVTQVFQAWMDSPGHRAAILYPAFTDIGIGIKNRYWVQQFGTTGVVTETRGKRR